MAQVMIVDYGVGNLFSVEQACRHVGLNPVVTSRADDLRGADGIILPGVGAFAYAMERLQALGMADVLKSAAAGGTQLMGVCLGFQLLFEHSNEMGQTPGLGLIPGRVTSLRDSVRAASPGLNVRSPIVSWLPVQAPARLGNQQPWQGTLLDGVEQQAEMYFVHSFHAEPGDPADVLAHTSCYDFDYCCAVARGSVFGCQFHPEKSARAGLQIYANFARRLGVT